LLFFIGARPIESKGTLIRLPVNLDGKPSSADNWQVKVTDLKDKVLTLTVTSEADAMVGRHELMFETKVKDSEKDFSNQDLDTIFYLLFNPWCQGQWQRCSKSWVIIINAFAFLCSFLCIVV